MELINKEYVDFDKPPRASKFLQSFNLTTTVVFLAQKTFLDSEDQEILKESTIKFSLIES